MWLSNAKSLRDGRTSRSSTVTSGAGNQINFELFLFASAPVEFISKTMSNERRGVHSKPRTQIASDCSFGALLFHCRQRGDGGSASFGLGHTQLPENVVKVQGLQVE